MNPSRKGKALTLILSHSGSSEVLKGAIDKAKVGDREKMEAIRRLRHFNVKVQMPNEWQSIKLDSETSSE
jgi:hypothetical protein